MSVKAASILLPGATQAKPRARPPPNPPRPPPRPPPPPPPALRRLSGCLRLLAQAVEQSVELRAQEEQQAADVEPEQYEDDARQGAVGLVVRPEARHVEGEEPARQQPAEREQGAARRRPAERLPHVRAGPEEHRRRG